jgi:hypothetical protein
VDFESRLDLRLGAAAGDFHGQERRAPGDAEEVRNVENFTPGYMQRALASWPKQGSGSPWRVYRNYIRHVISLSSIVGDSREFSNPPKSCWPPHRGELVRMAE